MIIIERAGITRQHLTVQVERIDRIASSITTIIHPIVFTRLDLIIWDREVLEVVGSFDKGGHEARNDVVLDMAVEEPDAWIVRSEAPDGVAILVEHDGVPTNRGRRDVGRVASRPNPCIRLRAFEDLELMPVQVHGVKVVVAIIDDKFDDGVVLQNKRVGVNAVYQGIAAVITADGEGGVQGGHLLREVGNVVDGEARDAVDGSALHV